MSIYNYFKDFLDFVKFAMTRRWGLGILVFWIFTIGWSSSGFWIQRWNPNYTPSTKERVKQLKYIENISWTIHIGSQKYFTTYSTILAWSKTRLWVEMYEFTKKEIKSTFKTLASNWVNIQLILENKKFQQYQNTFKNVQNYLSGFSNFQIKPDDQMWTKYVHAKFILVDTWFLIQTANFTHSSFFTNREYFFWSHDLKVLKSLETIFTKDWLWEKIHLEDIHPNLVVCPLNCRAITEHLISSAQSSIAIENQYINDPAVAKLLKTQMKKLWTWVQILLADTSSSADFLWKSDKSLVKTITKPYLHAKMLLVDNKILLLSSINLSSNSMDKNREMWILLIDTWQIETFKKHFLIDWKLAKISK